MKILFACDLDNTLIYSYKKKEDGYICVEMNKGKEQGFMTRFTFENFESMTHKADFLPVTTRSIEQYRRIIFPNSFIPKYSLVTHGATLMQNGKVTDGWSLSNKYHDNKDELALLYEKNKDDDRFINCRIVDDSYLFVYCKNDVDTLTTYNLLKNGTNLKVELSGKKIYFFPINLSKGNALKEFIKEFDYDYVIAAGDSSMDTDMLNEADLAIVPHDYECSLSDTLNILKCPKDYKFSDFVIKSITNLPITL